MRKLYFFFTFISISGFANSGADLLMQSVKPESIPSPPVSKSKLLENPVVSPLDGIQLTDPFLAQLFASWQAESKLPYEVNLWVLKILKKDFAAAAHLWSVIEPKLPPSFSDVGQSSMIYCLWNLNIPQTFFNEWVRHLEKPAFRNSRMMMALDQTIGPTLPAWLEANAVQLSPEQIKLIGTLDISKNANYLMLNALTKVRSGEGALPILEKLPVEHPLKIQLAETVALAYARRNDLGKAASILKHHVEPTIEATKQPKRLLKHYLQIARFLYQAGALDAAEQFYQKIPTGSPEFLTAREELIWVWLRKGNTQNLRGELTTLRSELLEKVFAPDVYVVRSISNLKLCYFDEAEKDLKAFIQKNEGWAKEITSALASTPAVAPTPDYFSENAERALKSREKEVEELERLSQHSITAVLPAVGPQNHWVRAKERVVGAVEVSKKMVSEEYRRQWKNRKQVLAEAIRKMQFVKVELMSQIQQLAKLPAFKESNTLKIPDKTIVAEEAKEIAFPFDGIVWSDELFRVRSAAQGRCLEAMK